MSYDYHPEIPTRIDDGLLESAETKAERAGHPVVSRGQLVNRALFLYLSLDNADEILAGRLETEGSG